MGKVPHTCITASPASVNIYVQLSESWRSHILQLYFNKAVLKILFTAAESVFIFLKMFAAEIFMQNLTEQVFWKRLNF